MNNKTQIKLSRSHTGRMILHLACLNKDKKFSWHIKGIKRELTIH